MTAWEYMVLDIADAANYRDEVGEWRTRRDPQDIGAHAEELVAEHGRLGWEPFAVADGYVRLKRPVEAKP